MDEKKATLVSVIVSGITGTDTTPQEPAIPLDHNSCQVENNSVVKIDKAEVVNVSSGVMIDKEKVSAVSDKMVTNMAKTKIAPLFLVITTRQGPQEVSSNK